MNVVVAYNPIAGRGLGARVAAEARAALTALGHPVRLVETGDEGALRRSLDGSAVCAIVGGDGTVNLVAAVAGPLGVPVYQLPTGTENLFSRAFGMGGGTSGLCRAVEAGRVEWIDSAAADGRTFLLMASAGFDAGVVERLSRTRRGSISHLSYAGPVLAELMGPRDPPLDITVDGGPFVRRARGLVVVANCRQYALRLDPARDADPRDGLLDVVFVPMEPAEIIPWMFRLRLGLGAHDNGVLRTRGRQIRIESEGVAAPLQCDGEAAGFTPVDIVIRPRSVAVLRGDATR
ncbi:MAG: hypothetical protein IBJ11_04235 [Phycisphaerales bacterium]|nr:hypothetical protein [Phycisphaerales bacterium]